MRTRLIRQRFVGSLTALIILGSLAIPAAANHAWENYHWPRTANPFTIQVGDNVSSKWDPFLDEAIFDWNPSPVLDLTEVAGGTRPSNCRPTSGRIEVCNARYGKNGFLGVATVWAQNWHITQATAKLNDTYFNTSAYNTPAWRRLVTCQEIAHGFGLGHQDEAFGAPNLGSCMDYTNDPDGGAYGPSNEHPDQHDFDQLVTIYTHLDSSTTAAAARASAAAAPELGDDPRDWGEVIERDGKGRPTHFRKDLGHGQKVFTFVIYADAAQDQGGDRGAGNDGNKGGRDR
jgi:hypothetical protein